MLLNFFNELGLGRAQGLLRTQVWGGINHQSGGDVRWRLADGRPLLTTDQRGRGRVAMFSTSLDRDLSDLAIRAEPVGMDGVKTTLGAAALPPDHLPPGHTPQLPAASSNMPAAHCVPSVAPPTPSAVASAAVDDHAGRSRKTCATPSRTGRWSCTTSHSSAPRRIWSAGAKP